MSTTAPQARLKDALRELNLAWRRARDDWRDRAADEFHKEVIGPLEPRVAQTLNAMATLGEAIALAKREAE